MLFSIDINLIFIIACKLCSNYITIIIFIDVYWWEFRYCKECIKEIVVRIIIIVCSIIIQLILFMFNFLITSTVASRNRPTITARPTVRSYSYTVAVWLPSS